MASTSDERGDADKPESPGRGAGAERSDDLLADGADRSATTSDSTSDDAGDPVAESYSSSDDAGPPSGADATPGQMCQSGRIRQWMGSARRLPTFFKLLAAISAAALTALLVLAVVATAQAVFDDGYDDGWFAYSTNSGPDGRDLVIEGVHHNGHGGSGYVYDRFDEGFGRPCDGDGFCDTCGWQRGLKHRGSQKQYGLRGWAPSDGKGDAAPKRFMGVLGRCGGDSDWGSLDDLHGSFGGRFGLDLAPRWWSGGPGSSEWFELGPRGWLGPFGNGGPTLESSGDAAPFGLFGGADPFTNPTGALGLPPGIGPEELSELRGLCEQFRTLLDGSDGDGLSDELPQIGVNELLLGVLCLRPDTLPADPFDDGYGAGGSSDSDDDARDDDDADDPTAADPSDA